MDMTLIVTFGVPIALLVIEHFLGETDKVEANSTLGLLRNILKVVAGKK